MREGLTITITIEMSSFADLKSEDSLNSELMRKKLKGRFYPGESVTCTGDLEIDSMSRRLPDDPGE